MKTTSLARGIVVLSVLGLAAFGGAARAATATATTTVSGLSGSLLSFSNDQYLSDASTPYQAGFDTGSTLTTFSFSTTQPNGDTSVATIGELFAPGPETSAAAIHRGQGSATVLWSFDWVATSTGTASIDLEYLYSATVSGHQPGETAVASSAISLLLENSGLATDALHFFDNVNGNTSGLSNLFLAFGVTEGQTGTFTVSAASNALVAPVPVPAALPLLLSGLAGAGVFARRRRRGAATP